MCSGCNCKRLIVQMLDGNYMERVWKSIAENNTVLWNKNCSLSLIVGTEIMFYKPAISKTIHYSTIDFTSLADLNGFFEVDLKTQVSYFSLIYRLKVSLYRCPLNPVIYQIKIEV